MEGMCHVVVDQLSLLYRYTDSRRRRRDLERVQSRGCWPDHADLSGGSDTGGDGTGRDRFVEEPGPGESDTHHRAPSKRPVAVDRECHGRSRSVGTGRYREPSDRSRYDIDHTCTRYLTDITILSICGRSVLTSFVKRLDAPPPEMSPV